MGVANEYLCHLYVQCCGDGSILASIQAGVSVGQSAKRLIKRDAGYLAVT